MFPELKFLLYEERLVKLRLWTLEERRNRADLIEVFKLVKGLVNNPFDIFLVDKLQSSPWSLLETKQETVSYGPEEVLFQCESG